MARRLWWGMLQWMRSPTMRRLQTWPLRRMRPERRARAMAHLKRQNRLARKIGLPLTRLSILCVVGSVLISLAYQVVLTAAVSGTFTVPEEIRQRAATGP